MSRYAAQGAHVYWFIFLSKYQNIIDYQIYFYSKAFTFNLK